MYRFLTSTFICILFFLFLSAGKPAFASRLYVSPANSNILVGSEQTIAIRLDTQGEAINAVQATLAYPSSDFDVLSIQGADSFAVPAFEEANENLITIARGNIEPVNGDVLVATITLRPRKTGVNTLSFTQDSAAPRFSDSSDSLVLSESSGIVFTVTEGSVEASSDTSEPATIQNILDTILALLQNLFN